MEQAKPAIWSGYLTMDFTPGFVDEFETLLRWRRDVRHFRTDPLPEADVLHLIEIACLSPSVGNAQPWRFVRVRSPGLRAALADHVDAMSARAAERYDDARRARYAALKLHGLREAPEIIAVFSDDQPAAGHGLGIATMADALPYSTVTAIHSLWLTARAKGIGLGWVSIVNPRVVAQILDVPVTWRLIGLLCLGYPVEESEVPELERRGWQERDPWQEKLFER
ncbi:MAG: 5,6-dimethylbenzimidazole synthase [Rhizorhabdus sp.]|nr:5,6-dimethylbenzimidazole synthase [Rhizorhabdus sp.]